MKTVTTDELPPRLDVFVERDDETRDHDHYNMYRGGVEWECEKPSLQARKGCYSDMLKRMRGMLPGNWTVSKPKHEEDRTTAHIGPAENIDEPAMKSNMIEQKLREVVREEIEQLNEAIVSGRGAVIQVSEASEDLSGAYMMVEHRGGGSAHVTLSPGSIRKLIKELKKHL